MQWGEAKTTYAKTPSSCEAACVEPCPKKQLISSSGGPTGGDQACQEPTSVTALCERLVQKQEDVCELESWHCCASASPLRFIKKFPHRKFPHSELSALPPHLQKGRTAETEPQIMMFVSSNKKKRRYYMKTICDCRRIEINHHTRVNTGVVN